jgi:hypothetical protein
MPGASAFGPHLGKVSKDILNADHFVNCCQFQVGLEKLLAAEGEVNVMKQELIDLQPKLIETGEREGSSVIYSAECRCVLRECIHCCSEECAAA